MHNVYVNLNKLFLKGACMKNRSEDSILIIVLGIFFIVCVLVLVWSVVNSNITWVLISLSSAGIGCVCTAIGIIS